MLYIPLILNILKLEYYDLKRIDILIKQKIKQQKKTYQAIGCYSKKKRVKIHRVVLNINQQKDFIYFLVQLNSLS